MRLSTRRRALMVLGSAAIAAGFLSLTTAADPPTTRPTTAPAVRVLLIAGGTSHDFKRWFEDYDAATLRAAGFAVTATEDPAAAAAGLASADVAVVSTNQAGFDTPAVRTALFAFAARGKGLVLLHPAVWYNYDRWPEYNAELVGGGTRSHDPIAPFAVAVLKHDHPVMAGLPAAFDVTDELYHVNQAADARPAGTVLIDVLAQTAASKKYGTPHPAVWVPKTDGGRVVCIALGHDGRVHKLEAFKKILLNAVNWTTGR